VEIPRLRAAVFKALKERGMRREIERLREEAGRPLGIEGIVGSSARWKRFCGRSAWSLRPG